MSNSWYEEWPISTLSRISRDSRRQIIALLLEHGQLSRADLSRLAGLNKPTVSNLVASLIEAGMIREVGEGISTGGRKPILLEVAADHRLIAGVEVDASGCRLVLKTLVGAEAGSAFIPLTAFDPESVVEAIAGQIGALLVGMPGVSLLGCGVAVPGIVDQRHDCADLPAPFHWRSVFFRADLEDRLHAPVVITDRGKAAGLGEMWHLGRDHEHDLVYLYLGDGVGGAIVVGQKIHTGVGNVAGEIGHMVIDPDGPPCSCGRHGCVEAMVSTDAILRLVQAGDTSCDQTPVHLQRRGVAARIGALARDGDAAALTIIETIANRVGIAVSNLINVLNPGVVVLGGPTTVWGTPFLNAVNEHVQRSALQLAVESTRIVIGEAGELAAALGAATLVRQRGAELLIRSRGSVVVGFQAGGR